jgi:cold shock CspA family protein
MGGQMWGIIKKITDRGFGFITTEASDKDIFFRSSSLIGIRFDDLHEGDAVGFTTQMDSRGIEAVVVGFGFEPRVQKKLQIVTSGLGLAHSPTESLGIESSGPDASRNSAQDSPTESLEIESSGPDASSVSPQHRPTDSLEIESIQALTDEVIRFLSKKPTDIYQLHAKVFEELVAEIFKSEGFTTELMGSWNQADGGVDIIAVRRDIGGFPVRYAIQCKRYADHRLITADPIRGLAGVLDRFHAHAGVIATTSHFTKPAQEEVEAHFWKINLRDYESIVASLQRLELLRSP